MYAIIAYARERVNSKCALNRKGSDIKGGAFERVRAFRIEGVKIIRIMEEYTMVSVIRGHHVYKSIWHPILGEQLVLEREREAMVTTDVLLV